MLFFLCFRPAIEFQGGSPLDPLFEPPADPPFDSTSQKVFLSSFQRLWQKYQANIEPSSQSDSKQAKNSILTSFCEGAALTRLVTDVWLKDVWDY